MLSTQIKETEAEIAALEAELIPLRERLEALVDVSVAPVDNSPSARVASRVASVQAEQAAKPEREAIKEVIADLETQLTRKQSNLAELRSQQHQAELRSKISKARQTASLLSQELDKALEPVMQVLGQIKALNDKHSAAYRELQELEWQAQPYETRRWTGKPAIVDLIRFPQVLREQRISCSSVELPRLLQEDGQFLVKPLDAELFEDHFQRQLKEKIAQQTKTHRTPSIG